MLEIHEITSADQFFDLRSSWNDVLSKSRDDSPFLTWEHVAVSVKHLSKEQNLRLLYITNDNKIVAIAPLRQSKRTFKDFFTYNVIEFLDYGDCTDYTGLILTDNAAECLKLFLKHLWRQDNWDYLCINDVPETSELVNLLTKSCDSLPKFEINEGPICPYIAVPDSMETFLKSLRGDFRRSSRRCLRNLEEDHGKVEFKDYYELGSLEDTTKLFFDIHQKRWLSKGEPGAFFKQESRDIFLDRARLFAEKDWLALNFLTVNERPIAAMYSLKYSQKMYSCLTGFDPAYSSYSVGNLLHLKAVEKCIKQGFREYDFLKGNETYKFLWTKNFRRNMNLKLVSRRLSSKLIKLGMEALKII